MHRVASEPLSAAACGRRALGAFGSTARPLGDTPGRVVVKLWARSQGPAAWAAAPTRGVMSTGGHSASGLMLGGSMAAVPRTPLLPPETPPPPRPPRRDAVCQAPSLHGGVWGESVGAVAVVGVGGSATPPPPSLGLFLCEHRQEAVHGARPHLGPSTRQSEGARPAVQQVYL